MTSTELLTSPEAPTAETAPSGRDESGWTPLFDALCAELGHPIGTPA
ncbi:hypothetical protein [Actinokineospora alba]|nr:hypothetical protein [Actinokineospora alba]